MTVQERDPAIDSDLAWSRRDRFQVTPGGTAAPDLVLWRGTVRWSGADDVVPDRYRLM